MKYFGKTKILIPWYDTTGMKQRSLVILEGTIDRRALMKGIHAFIKKNFNKQVSNSWILKNCPIINQWDNKLSMISNKDAIAKQFQEELNAWLFKMEAEADAIENGTNSGSEIQTIAISGEPLPTLPHTIDNSGSVS